MDNKGGAAGTIALALVANAKPDGYTLCAGTSTGVVRAPQMQKVTYKPLKSFTPIIGYATPQNAIVVRSDAPWKTLKELSTTQKEPEQGEVQYYRAWVQPSTTQWHTWNTRRK